MTRTKTLMLASAALGGLLAMNLLFIGRDAAAQPADPGQKWEYATLTYEEPLASDFGHVAMWTTGKKITAARWQKEAEQNPFTRLNRELGGDEQYATLVVLLNRIGQQGWELVSHTRNDSPARINQAWMFKRKV